jgi:hypothetical protein
MKKLTATLLSAITLIIFSTNTLASSVNVTEANMQHYIFTYHVNKNVNPVSHLYSETGQNMNYVLALDIQRQVHRNLDTMANADGVYQGSLTAKSRATTRSSNNRLVAL